MNRFYRVLYLIFTWLVTAFILNAYAVLLIKFLLPGNTWREYIVCGGQLFFQGFIIMAIDRNKTWNYLGNMMTISFAGALLLIPLLCINSYMQLDPWINMAWFLLVAALMLLEHIRRARLLQVNYFMSISWVIYRIIVLLVLLNNI